MAIRKDFPAMIRAARLSAGFSQGDLEAETGISRTYLSRLECGYTSPNLTTLQKITAACGLSLPEFLDGKSPKTAPISDADIVYLRTISKISAALTADQRHILTALARRLASKP